MTIPITPETLAALEEAGYAVVPVGHDHMTTSSALDAGKRAYFARSVLRPLPEEVVCDVYNAMIAAGRLRPSDLKASHE
jgi:lysozyme family protein